MKLRTQKNTRYKNGACVAIDNSEFVETLVDAYRPLYENLYGNIENAIKVISAAQNEKSAIFNRENYYMLFDEKKDNLIGMNALWKPGNEFDLELERFLLKITGVEEPKEFQIWADNYFLPSWNGKNLTKFKFGSMVLKPEFRGQGFGDCIMQRLDNVVEQQMEGTEANVKLTVMKGNLPAINLYKKSGFEIVGKRDIFESYDEKTNTMTTAPAYEMEKCYEKFC